VAPPVLQSWGLPSPGKASRAEQEKTVHAFPILRYTVATSSQVPHNEGPFQEGETWPEYGI
jgi:hypothetical protein